MITEHEITKGKISTRHVVVLDDESLTMSYSWDSFIQHMTSDTEEYELADSATKGKEDMPPQSAIHDEDTREKIRLKCNNDWDLLLTEEQVSMCIIEQEETGLSLFHNQLWPNSRNYKKKVKDNNGYTKKIDATRITWDKTIDGYRAVAARTGLYAGVDAPVFRREKVGENEDLVACVTVYRLGPNGQRSAFVGEARFAEFVQMVTEWGSDRKPTGRKTPNHMWAEMPNNQLAMAAERQALRRAFQSCDDDQAILVPLPESSLEPQPQLELSRGKEVQPEDAPDGNHSVEAASEPEPKKEEKPKGTYVGIPPDGFVLFAKYNKDERIILIAKKEGRTILALDSGERVTISDDGMEVDRRARTDKSKGGRKWKEGDSYFDGAKITKTAGSKKDEFALRVMLDSGFEVRLDRWGKEERRKETKDKGPDPKTEESKSPEPEVEKPEPKVELKESAPDSVKVEHDPRVGADVVETTAPESATPDSNAGAKAPGDNKEVDIDDIEDVAQLRLLSTPLLKKYCDTILKRRVSPKEAYKELTGVLLNKGQTMSIDDYRVLYQCLEEALEETSSNGRKAG